jgi:hypothetical protein
MPGTPSPDPISTKRQRIATLARDSPQAAFTTLAHHIDIDWLTEAYLRTRKDGAVGVDGQTAADYAADLEGNLRSLLDRAKSGRYQAPPVRRVHIPKWTGSETRPIGIPTFEDKVLRHPHVRGQGPPACGGDGPGGRLRAGLPGLLVRLPAGPLGAPGARHALASDDGGRWRVGPGDRHSEVFRDGILIPS